MQKATPACSGPSLRAGVLLAPSIAPWLALVIASACLASEPAAQGWRARLPDGWLAIAAARDAAKTEQAIVGLLDDLAFDYAGIVDQLRLAAGLGDVVLASREVVVGWAVDPSSGDHGNTAPYAFALAPTDDFAGFVRSCRGEMAGAVGVTTLVGVDLCLVPCRGWAFVAEVERLEAARGVMRRVAELPPGRPTLSSADAAGPDLMLQLSPAGLDHAWRRAAATDPKARRRALAEGVPWPPTLAAFDAAFGQNAPLLDAWRGRLRGAQLTARVENQQVRFRLTAPLVDPPPPGGAALPALATAMNPSRVVAELRGTAGPLSKLVGPLYLAYAKGRPDEIDARAYEEANYRDFADAAARALSHVEAFHAVALPRGEGEPVLAGQAVLVRVDDRDAFLAATSRVASRWNTLVSASRARMPLLFEADPAPEVGGLAFSVDMVKAFGVRRSREIDQLLQGLFGPDGRWHRLLLPVRQDLVLLADLPTAEAVAIAKRLADANPAAGPSPPVDPPAWRGTLEVDLAAALLQTWRKANRPGGRVREAAPIRRSPPLRARAELVQAEFRCEAVISRDTLRAIGGSLQASRAK